MTELPSNTTDWTLPGAAGETIHGTTHLPDGDAEGVVVLVHGFKGYKDYGMFPHVAHALSRAGWIVHRVSLSHSGMGHGHGTFDEDLFQRDTWNRGVEDLQALCMAIDRGTLAGQGAGTVLVGHSRGGALVLLAAGRHAGDGTLGALRGVVAVSSPAELNPLSDDECAMLQEEGRLPTPSSRTNQLLHIGESWLREQFDDPHGHDLLGLVPAIPAPVLLVHGADDPTVPASSAVRIAQAAPQRVKVELVEGADHVFNTPNPFDSLAAPSPQLTQLESALLAHIRSVG